jgi:hypothetical protein
MQSSAIDQTLQEPGIRFDAAKLNWIGNPTVDNLVTIAGQGADPAGGDAVAAGRLLRLGRGRGVPPKIRQPRMPDGRPNFTAQDRTISPVLATNGW